MSSWALMPALSGFACDVAAGRLAFAPAIAAEDFRCLFSAGTAWGTFAQRRDARTFQAALTVAAGRLELRLLTLAAAGARAGSADIDGEGVAFRLEQADNDVQVVFDTPPMLGADTTLHVYLTLA
jgi:hypothetical protein